MITSSYYNNVSYLVDRYIPSSIKDNYPLFYDFIETYYEYLQQNDKFVPYNVIKNIQNWNDIDTTIDEFIEHFKDEYINLPETDDLALYIKHHKEIYNSKGSTRSLKFFIKLLTGLDTDVMYPNRYLMKSSDGVWRQYKIIFCERDVNRDYSKYISTTVTGGISGATGVIEKIELYDNYIKIFLSSYKGNFISEPVFFNNGEQFRANIINTISSINIVKGGNNYHENDTISITNYPDIKVKIEDIYSGSLDNIEIVNGGTGYQVGDIINFQCDRTEEYYALPYVEVAEVVLPKWNFTYDIELDLTQPGTGYSVNDVLSYGDIQVQIKTVGPEGQVATFNVLTPVAFTQVDSDNVMMSGGTGQNAVFKIHSTQNELTNEDEIGKIVRVKILYSGYGLLEVPQIVDITTSEGQGAEFTVGSDFAGAIRNISITYPGCNIIDEPNIQINTETGFGAELTYTIQYDCQENPYYYKAGSFLSDVFKLQDSYYWQEYSYVLNIAGSVLDKYRDLFKSILHPAGFIYFTNTILSNYIEVKKSYVNSTLDVFNDLSTYLYFNQYIELLHYYDRIRNENILANIKTRVLEPIKERTLDSFKRVGGGFIINSTLDKNTVTFTINPTPSDATVVINEQETRSVVVIKGSTVNYSVSRAMYATVEDSVVVNEDTTLDIVLEQNTVTFTINPTPSDATVVINGENTRSVIVEKGSTVNYSVSSYDYVTVEESTSVNENTTLNVDLKLIEWFAEVVVVPLENGNLTYMNARPDDMKWMIDWGDGNRELLDFSKDSTSILHHYNEIKEYTVKFGV